MTAERSKGDWRSSHLRDVLERIIDYRGISVPKSNSGIPLITARNVGEGALALPALEFIAESDYDAWMTRGIPKAGDILFTTDAPLGKAARFPFSGQYALGQRVVALRP